MVLINGKDIYDYSNPSVPGTSPKGYRIWYLVGSQELPGSSFGIWQETSLLDPGKGLGSAAP